MNTEPQESQEGSAPVPAESPATAPADQVPAAEITASGPQEAPLRSRLRPQPGPPGAIPSGRPPQGVPKPSGAPRQQPRPAGKPKRRREESDADEVRTAEPAAADQPVHRVPVPTRRHSLPADLELELSQALGEQSVDELLGGTGASLAAPTIELDSRLRATVVRMHKDNVFFSLGGPNEGVASLRQFAEPPELGASFGVVVARYNAEDGLYELAVPGGAVEVVDWSNVMEGTLVEARVTAANAGGLECMVNQIRGFIPASQVGLYRVENLADFVNEKFVCMVTEANPQKGNLVLSRRSVLEREKEEARQALLEQLQEGDVRDGVVRSIRDFGAFVDLGGVDGLLHISQLSWDRVQHPSEVLEEGQRVRVRVEKVDRQTGKISLSYRSLQEHPWEKVPQQFPVGTVVRGVVSRLAKFGAFVKLAPGVEGLIHISELSTQRVANVAKVLQEGQEVQAKVVSLDVENQRIGLSLKALMAAAAAEEEEVAEEETPSEAPTPRHRGPLKGGVDRSSGGDKFGLKW